MRRYVREVRRVARLRLREARLRFTAVRLRTVPRTFLRRDFFRPTFDTWPSWPAAATVAVVEVVDAAGAATAGIAAAMTMPPEAAATVATLTEGAEWCLAASISRVADETSAVR